VTIEIRPVRGPVTDEELGWIAGLYGAVDSKYSSTDFVRHQVVDNPFGWSAHVFVLDDGRAVGHCCAVPFSARRGGTTLVAGKIEAVVVAAEYRGRRADGRNLATEMLSRLYPFGIECGMDGLFGFAPPHVARVHVRAGCHEVPADAPAYTLLTHAAAYARSEVSARRRATVELLGAAQAITSRVPRLVAGPSGFRVETPAPTDAELAAANVDTAAWTVSGADAWEWFAGSGTLEVLELPGQSGSRALVRIPQTGASPAQIVAWRPRSRGLRPALRLLDAAARLARERGAPTLRFQPWPGDGGNGSLARACALAGLVRRPEAPLVVYSPDAGFDRLRVTPFLYVTF